MANPALLLIKPLLKSIGKEAVKVLGKTAASSTASAGVKAAAQGALSAVDAVNIARAAVDKKMAGAIAKSLGMTTKELNAITKGLNMTDARKAAVKGRNYVRNLNRFLESPEKSIKAYAKNQLRQKANKTAKDLTDEMKEGAKKRAVINGLKMLDGKLKNIHPTVHLSDRVWANTDNIDIEDVYAALAYVEMDLYDGTSGQTQKGEIIFTDSEHKGYKGAMELDEFMAMMEDMLLQDFHSTTIDGIY